MIQMDMFGVQQPADRGWTELDRLRRRCESLERQIAAGDLSLRVHQEFEELQREFAAREKEAREAWAKSFRS